MAQFGEEIHATFLILKENPTATAFVLGIPSSTVKDCPTCLNVFADIINADTFRNDKTAFLFKFNELVTSITFILQKKANGIFTDVIPAMVGDSMGTLFPLGFIIDEKKRKYTGYLIAWRNVLMVHGEGLFRLKTIQATVLGFPEQIQLSEDFCLKKYTPERADGTVKIETTTLNIRGDIKDKKDVIDFGSVGWYNSTRLCGIFGFDTSDYVDERVEFRNGQQKWTKDEQTPKFILKLKPVNSEMHNFIKTDILQSDEILITDYNKNNPNKHIRENVNRAGNYEPRWERGTKLAPVDISFVSAFNNLRKKLC